MIDIRTAICEELRAIEKKHHVRVLYAVESGSRAWGFASPDSDYDVRCVYVRPAGDYLRLEEPRDVIEWVNDGILDINGWDLKKALKHFAKGNATLFEWSNSPIVYETTADWNSVRDASAGYFSEKAAAYHYYGTAMNTWSSYLTEDTVRYKKYFYALRPLLAAIYIEQNHKAPPVLFDDLLKRDISPDLRAAIDELLEKKKVTTEGEVHPQIPLIRDFIKEELLRQKAICDGMPDDRNSDTAALENCFVKIIGLDQALPRCND